MAEQLELAIFKQYQSPATDIDADWAPQLSDYDYVVLSSSAGKDSQAMLDRIFHLAMAQGYSLDRIVVVHADLGRAEWTGTGDLAERQAKAYGFRFVKVSRPQGDLVDRIRNRGMWPGHRERYCTAELKRNQIHKVIRALAPKTVKSRVLDCQGIRAQESKKRAEKAPWQPDRKDLRTRSRTVDTWYPIHHWTLARVWETIKASGVPYHPAYDLGMPRLSCVFCIFAPQEALELAAYHNRELLDVYCELEQDMQHTFTQDISLQDIRRRLDAGHVPSSVNTTWTDQYSL